jgi:hypothetical protein
MKPINSSTPVIIYKDISRIRSISGNQFLKRRSRHSIGYTLEGWAREGLQHFTTLIKMKESLLELYLSMGSSTSIQS